MNDYRINSTPSFTGIYKLKNVDMNMLQDVRRYLPPVKTLTRQDVQLFSGEYPLESYIVEAAKNTVQDFTQYSYDWLIRNAKNHGISLPTDNVDDVWFFTGKDAKLVSQFIDNATKMMEKDSSFFGRMKERYIHAVKDSAENLPEHLKHILPLVRKHGELIQMFKDLIKGKQVVEVTSVQKLLQQILLDA